MQQPGQIVGGRYRIGKLIGAGGMGAVYEARHLVTDHAVAIKLLDTAKDGVKGHPSPLEAKVDARVGSAHIVHVYDAGVDERLDAPFIVMELLRGATLERVIERHPQGRLPAAEALHLLEQLALGLEAAHSYAVVHCDLKPENVFVTSESTVKILDFGIARVLAASAPVTRDQRGTPFYMAPEQARGEPVSAQTDIWAFGLVAYRVLTGRHYWRSAQRRPPVLAELVYEMTVARQQPASVRLAEQGARLELPAAFDAWFSRCIALTPQARFPSARAAMSALEAAFEPLSYRAVLPELRDDDSPHVPSTQPTKTYDDAASVRAADGSRAAARGDGSRRAPPVATARRRAVVVGWVALSMLGVAYWQRPIDPSMQAAGVAPLRPGLSGALLVSEGPRTPSESGHRLVSEGPRTPSESGHRLVLPSTSEPSPMAPTGIAPSRHARSLERAPGDEVQTTSGLASQRVEPSPVEPSPVEPSPVEPSPVEPSPERATTSGADGQPAPGTAPRRVPQVSVRATAPQVARATPEPSGPAPNPSVEQSSPVALAALPAALWPEDLVATDNVDPWEP